MVHEKIYAFNCKWVREVLEDGGRIAVVGWMDKNHSDYTREIPASIVSFHEADPRTLPEKLDLVIFTRFGSHKRSTPLRARYPCMPGVIETGNVKEILKSCVDVIARRTGISPRS